ncbi:Lichenase, partial [Cucurbita argyrosperma subsp. sororia]
MGRRNRGLKSGNMVMAIEDVDSMALLPFGSASRIGSFFRLPQCGGPRRTESIGVCYTNLGNNLPDAREVVQLYKIHGIEKMRIYNPDTAILNALRGLNIEVIVGIPNTDLERIVNLSSASNWVQRNIQAYVPHIKFRYVAVGNDVQPSDSIARYVLPAISSINSAISAANLQDQIKVSTVISISLLSNSSFPPSYSSFSSEASGFIEPIVHFLAKNGSPLLANVYPYFTYTDISRTISLDYALFMQSPTLVIRDGNFEYNSLFESMVDALYVALEKSGGAEVSIVIAESGWPSNGSAAATVENAGTYYRNLMNFVPTGTPRRPRRAIETYLFAMFDENLKPVEMEKHFGLFTADKKSKYQLSFS